TKLRMPPLTRHLVRRARLVDALERGVRDYKLVLIATPAGYGKTTLLAEWAHASRFPIAWLSISAEDNDPDRFFRYLLTAWAAVQPAVSESPLGLLLGAMAPDRAAVLAAFINVASEAPDHTVFVLDDYHLIEDASIHQGLAFLLDHLPPTLHVVLAGRGEPPLPLARYRARHELLELRTRDLHFLADEAREFMNRLMGLDLSQDEIAPLHAQLEGWIAGLQLLSLTLRRHREAADPLNVSGRHRFIADYLSEDVLNHLPDDLQRFLLRSSILDRLCGSLCDATIGCEGGQAMLELLERENLFLVSLDDDRTWFRYHRLFADFLREELRRRYPAEVAQLHRDAADWYLARDLAEPAFQHAVAGDDLHLGVQIVDRYANLMLQSGEFRDMQRWLDSLPAAWHAAHPALNLFRAGLLAFTGDFAACERCVDDVERQLVHAEGEDARWQRAKVAAIRCAIACMQNDLPRAEGFAAQALRDLPNEDLGFRPLVYGALGDSYRQNGRWDEAKASYLNVLDFTHAPGVRVEEAHFYGALADLDLRQGRLRGATGYWQKALAAVQERENWGRLELPAIGWVYLRMGELLYEHNAVAAAWDHLVRGLERAELGGDARAMIAGYLMAGRVKLTEGDIESAAAYLERARPLLERAPFPDWACRFDRFQLQIWLAQDRLRTAVDWATRALERGALDEHPEPEVECLALAHVLIVKGDDQSRSQALVILDQLSRAAQAEGRMGVEIEALTLHAMAHWRAGDRTGAMISFERSLRLAEPEGYVRLFIDYGQPVIQLLHEARRRKVLPGYVTRLLAAAGDGLAGANQATLAEPLSDREQEVLALMAAGLTNREIAADLSIAAETVKKHTSSIFGKLGAANRTEAAAKARALDLLS
ncbi:MAG: LuxR C-terminal-related transcriptional regulator, partial [Chloroflexota bacterium]|nr:LuxR C-terminal-related transcriptional regulator [Chloroflexota bacterium]